VPDALAGECGGNRHLFYVGIIVEHCCNDVSGDLALFLRYPDQPLSLTSTQGLPIRHGLRDLWHADRVEDLASLALENGQVVEVQWIERTHHRPALGRFTPLEYETIYRVTIAA